MNLSVEVQKMADSIFLEKAEGTAVNYFLYPQFEVHLNTIFPKTIQGWHSHSVVEEVLVITKGAFIVESIVENELLSAFIEKGDVVRVNNSIHRLLNPNDKAAEFVVFRFISKNEDNSEKIKQDKTEYSEDQIRQRLNK